MLTLPEHLISPFNVVHVVPFLFTSFAGQAFYWSTILVLFALVWTDFNVDEYIIGMRLQCCCIWIESVYSTAIKSKVVDQ